MYSFSAPVLAIVRHIKKKYSKKVDPPRQFQFVITKQVQNSRYYISNDCYGILQTRNGDNFFAYFCINNMQKNRQENTSLYSTAYLDLVLRIVNVL